MKKQHFRTIWHPIFYTLIRLTRPQGYKVQFEVPLGTLPPRADLLVIRRTTPVVGRVRELPCIHKRLGLHTVLEYKGATDGAMPEDVGTLLGYASLYLAQNKLQGSEVVLMLLAGRLNPRLVATLDSRRAPLREVELGVWEASLAGHPFYFIELDRVWQGDVLNEALALATRAILDDEFTLKRMTRKTAEIYYEIGHALKGPMHYREEDMEGQKRIARSYERGLEKVLAKFPVSARLAGLAPKDWLEGLAPKDWLEGLAPKERLEGLAPKERLEGLAPKERLEGLAPKDRLEGLAPEERLEGLAPEEKRELFLTLQAQFEHEREEPSKG